MSRIKVENIRHPDGTDDNISLTDTGRVGIGTTSPTRLLTVQSTGNANFCIKSANTGVSQCMFGDTDSDVAGNIAYRHSDNAMTFEVNSTERARIDSSGRLLVGTSSNRDNYNNTAGQGPKLQVETVPGQPNNAIGIVRNSANGTESVFILGKSRGTTAGSTTALINNDNIGKIGFQGADGTNLVPAAAITAKVDGTPGTGSMPGRLGFYSTPSGSATPLERMRITSAGDVLVGTTNSSVETISTGGGINLKNDGRVAFTAQSSTVVYANRAGTDGTVIQIRHQGTQEGTISVSGTTVSYNGGHLARWSQLPGGVERTEILRGSVLSNIDEMCEWGEEDNEQLNRMKVSDVEGDKNVSGVFQAWDDDDDTYLNDFYCAMTGDFVIRIAQGVTVERGDLLMSAGDGTAKPQDDDIIRSKTIAKVTSTNVSCTYDDGSYCVPCVLMAC